MILIQLLALLGSAYCAIIPLQDSTDLAAKYRLSGDITPTFYDISLNFNPDDEAQFTGFVIIRATAAKSTSKIVLHAMEMQISQNDISVKNNLGEDLAITSFSLADDDTHFLTINLENELALQQVIIIEINFIGKYADNMFGAYVSRYVENGQEVKLVTSQLQPTFARRVFPCFDEPNFKAKFRTTIYAPPAYTVVRTNMPTRTNPDKEEIPGMTKHEFEDSEIMSTYLHGFLVSKFEKVNNNVNAIYRLPFAVFSRPGTQNNAAFALDFGQKSMVELEKYYDFPFVLPKLDKVAVPDFAAGAMENWGIVIYREVALLVAEGLTTTASKQNVGRIITHENIHFWFGNEVSPISWTYLWLSEGFASFFEYYGTDLVLPEWRMDDQFLLILQNVFQSDAVLSVNPMTHPVYSPSQVIGTFNSVAYQKSASVIRMMQHALTPDVFREGIRKYLKAMSGQAAEPSNLYANLQSAVTESQHSLPTTVANIMNQWVSQGGFPVLTITRSASTANSIVVTQERYLTDSSLKSTDLWHVPINWVLSSSPNFEDTKPSAWISPTASAVAVDIEQLSEAEWYIINKQQTGYYRVNYDEPNWVALSKVMNENHQIIHLRNRANLLDDAFNLARNGRLNYAHAFDMSRYLAKEKDYIPWGAVNPSFSYLDVILSASKAYPAFQKYLLELSAPLYGELTFDVKQGEEHVAAFHRNLILDLNCRHGNSDCTNKASELLESFRNDQSKAINPDIQTLVYCSALRGGSEANFQFLWDMYIQSSDSSEESILLNAMGCTSNAERLSFFLNQVIDPNSQVREQDRHTIIVAVINSSPQGMEAALNFVHENFAAIQQRVQGLTGTPNILNALARRLTSQEHATRIQQFVESHSAILTAGEQAAIDGIKENIAASISWSNKNLAAVEVWLNENYGSDGEGDGAAAITSSLVILISVVVTIFN